MPCVAKVMVIRAWSNEATASQTFACRMVAELGGVAVLQVVAGQVN